MESRVLVRFKMRILIHIIDIKSTKAARFSSGNKTCENVD